ncbi:MAG TPA: hypothetical protein VGN12_13225 [Pirellulales bacterium]
MTLAELNLSFHDERTEFAPGETLTAEYFAGESCSAEVEALEISVLWFTEGKGDEDFAVHYFQRTETSEAAPVDFRQPRQFSTMLPNSPLSYDGVILRIRWCVRLRAFLTRGKQLVEQRTFRLGNVPVARAVLP